jgi:hypothetical protein
MRRITWRDLALLGLLGVDMTAAGIVNSMRR